MYEEITDGVYEITVAEDGGRYRCFLSTNEMPILFDTGLEGTTDVIEEALETIGVVPEHVVITHGDPDHIGGLAKLESELDAKTWVPDETDHPSAALAGKRYGDGDRIGPYEAVHVPGHEPDNYALVDEDAGVAVMGDAVVGADQRGIPGGYFHLPPGVHSVDLNEAERSLERLLEYDFDVGLVFHGSCVRSDASEKLNRYVEFVGKP